jgi:hypothetical protein
MAAKPDTAPSTAVALQLAECNSSVTAETGQKLMVVSVKKIVQPYQWKPMQPGV